ncbi:MAG: helix-turn-helix transcriptional regulator [Clostridia bacterium]|nr:helix-turn-helix transcriptional regulator [Clostridia bacterium]
MSDNCIYWQHRSGDRLSDFYFDDPTLLLAHKDEYYEDFYIGRHTPSDMILRTVGYRRCDPEFQFRHMSFGGRYCIMYVFEGEGYVDGNIVDRGNVIFFDRRRISNFSTHPENLCAYGWITFTGGNSDEIVKKIGLSNKNCIYRIDNIDRAEAIFRDMLYVKHEENTELYMEGCLLRMLSLSEKPKETDVSEVASVGNRYLDSALLYISLNFKDPDFRISDVSTAVGVSENYLRTLFREELGVSMRDYIIEQRINIAVNLLRASNYNITEIAQFCGYTDYKNFFKQFKRRVGVSPSKFKIK